MQPRNSGEWELNISGGALGDVIEGIRAHIGRTLLIASAVALGAFSLTLLLAVSHGLALRTNALVRQLGNHTFAVLATSYPAAGPGLRLRTRDANLVASYLPGFEVSVVRNDTAPSPGHSGLLRVVATDSQLAVVRGWKLIEGRFLDSSDVVQAQRELVVTQSLATAWAWRVGKIVTLKRTAFRIVGVVQTPPGSLEAQVFAGTIVVPDKSVFVPYTVTPDWVSGVDLPVRRVDAIYVRSQSMAAIPQAVSTVTDLLMQTGVNVRQLQWITPAALSSGLNRLKGMVQSTAGGIAFLALILGGVTLASLMLANVQDRVVEIGLRRSFGAQPADVARIFVLEALIITGAASSLGMLSAVLVLNLAGPLPLPAQLDTFSLLAPLSFGLILGALSAWWPARLAANIEPAQALRQG